MHHRKPSLSKASRNNKHGQQFRKYRKPTSSKHDPRKEECLTSHFNNVLLVVGLGSMSDFESLPLYEIAYKKVFRNRVYCGPDFLSGEITFDGALFLKQNTRYGAFLYDCLTLALREHANYTGFIFVPENVLVNPKRLAFMNKNKIWVSNQTKPGPVLYEQTDTSLEWWSSPWGMQAIEKLFEYLVELSYYNRRKNKMTDGLWTSDWDTHQLLNRWLWNGKGEYRTYWSNETFLYLPARYSSLYLNATKHMRPSGVRQEIALPTIVKMLELDSNTQTVSAKLIEDSNSHILDNRDQFRASIEEHGLLYASGKLRKDRRKLLNHMMFKEYGVGQFLKYNHCN